MDSMTSIKKVNGIEVVYCDLCSKDLCECLCSVCALCGRLTSNADVCEKSHRPTSPNEWEDCDIVLARGKDHLDTVMIATGSIGKNGTVEASYTVAEGCFIYDNSIVEGELLFWVKFRKEAWRVVVTGGRVKRPKFENPKVAAEWAIGVLSLKGRLT